jgi:Ca2+/Na+ antiporter
MPFCKSFYCHYNIRFSSIWNGYFIAGVLIYFLFLLICAEMYSYIKKQIDFTTKPYFRYLTTIFLLVFLLDTKKGLLKFVSAVWYF